MKDNFLSEIVSRKQVELEAARKRIPEAKLMAYSKRPREHRSLFERLSTPGRYGVNIIAEVKRGSPSLGLIRPELDPAAFAASYEKGGAAAISVLTDESFFHGCSEDLEKARCAVRIPVLRKDFIISTYQIYESAVMGADAVLLIARVLSGSFLKACLDLCKDLELDALVEVHSREDIEEAGIAGATLVGINNRDLSTFKTNIETSLNLAQFLGTDQVAVSESGIHSRKQIEDLRAAGIWNFLIGESIVRAESPILSLQELLGAHNNA